MSDTDSTTTKVAEIFDDTTAAAYVGGIKSRAIRDWRTRRGLPFIRITAKVCRIRKTDLDKWLSRHTVAITKGASRNLTPITATAYAVAVETKTSTAPARSCRSTRSTARR